MAFPNPKARLRAANLVGDCDEGLVRVVDAPNLMGQ